MQAVGGIKEACWMEAQRWEGPVAGKGREYGPACRTPQRRTLQGPGWASGNLSRGGKRVWREEERHYK